MRWVSRRLVNQIESELKMGNCHKDNCSLPYHLQKWLKNTDSFNKELNLEKVSIEADSNGSNRDR
jgi:hypothetical protein